MIEGTPCRGLDACAHAQRALRHIAARENALAVWGVAMPCARQTAENQRDALHLLRPRGPLPREVLRQLRPACRSGLRALPSWPDTQCALLRGMWPCGGPGVSDRR